MKFIGWMLLIVGTILVISGCYDSWHLRWENPDATERRLWLDHNAEMWGQTLKCVGGCLMMMAAAFTKRD